ncbi:MAG: glycoside hydrolase family 13 protein [Bacilli bacterium]|nr:glycoside hydrolase family 13 protein [Bacilli bacterium]
MNEIALFHQPESAYGYAIDQHRYHLRLRVDKKDVIDEIVVLYNDKFLYQKAQLKLAMKRQHSDHFFAYYETIIYLDIPRLAYVFLIKSKGKSLYYSEDGLTEKYDFVNSFYHHFQIPTNSDADLIRPVTWVNNTVFYQIFVERFAIGNHHKSMDYINATWDQKPLPKSFYGGDLQGIIDHLDYLIDLGINAIYLTPINPSKSNHKYDISDYYDVDQMFGDKATLKNLIDRAHSNGIRVILDAVFNHCSSEHPWFVDVINNGKKSPYYDFFFIDGDYPMPNQHPLNYQSFAFTRYMPKLNSSNLKLQEELIKIGLYWIKEFDIDGWRLDVSDEVAHAFWRKFRTAIKSAKPEALIIGENWHRAHSWLQGDQFDSIMNYGYTKAALDYFAWHKLDAEGFVDRLNNLLMQYSDPINHMMLNLLDSHDTHRFYSECKEDIDIMLQALAFTIFFVGVPCIYYGTEVPINGGYDPDSRRGMPWNQLNTKNTYWQNVKKLIKIRKSEKSFNHFDYQITYENNLIIVQRGIENDGLILILADQSTKVEIKLKEVLFATGFDGKSLQKSGFIIARI